MKMIYGERASARIQRSAILPPNSLVTSDARGRLQGLCRKNGPGIPSQYKTYATPKDPPSAAVAPCVRCLLSRISRSPSRIVNYACAQRIKKIAFILCISQSVVGDRGLKLSSLPLSLKYPPRAHRSHTHRSVMIIRTIFSRCRCTRNAEIIFSSRFASSSALRHDEIEQARSEQEENKRWAKEPGARDVLAQPPFDSMTADTSRMLDSLEEYLQARRWHHPKGPARRFLSHLLTFPLTLATGLREVGLGVPPDYKAYSGAKNSTGAADGHSITVACIGARAESSLPPEFWRETLFALPAISSLDLHHIGPEVSHPSGQVPPTGSPGTTLPSSLARVGVDGRIVNISWTRALLGQESTTCVDPGDSAGTRGRIAAAEHSVAKSDAVVLFNPGLGHPHLRKGWEGALKRLLYTGKPLIVTCHSRTDLDRDVRHLHDFAQRWCIDWVGGRGLKVFPRENPFRSLIATEAPLRSAPEIVSSNWGMFVVPRGAKRSE